MIYRRDPAARLRHILIMISLGVLAAAVFLLHDRITSEQAAQPPPPTHSPAPIVALNELPEQPLVQQREITGGAYFSAPTANISSQVIQSYLSGNSWDVTELGRYVGHLQGTAWMSSTPGNIVLAGHVEMADGRRGIFASIGELSIGDPLYLSQDGEARMYQVTQLFSTTPDDLSVLYPTTQDRITLITCANYDFLRDSYLDRVVVIAERVA